jgi:hypothetical protein
MRPLSYGTPPAGDRLVAVLIADSAPDADWLEQTGVTAVGENGTWRLTAPAQVAMARFDGRSGLDAVERPGRRCAGAAAR